jgi:microcystin-dependent protein
MAEPFLSEIRVFSFNFAPKGWALCNGQLLPINQNQALFALLGTTYGGNGQTNFALPNLQGKAAIHVGAGHTQGEAAGSTAVTLSQTQMPTHTHFVTGSALDGNTPVPTTHLLAGTQAKVYTDTLTNLTTLHPISVTSVGGSQPHDNMMPYTVLNYCIALQGIFPSQN